MKRSVIMRTRALAMTWHVMTGRECFCCNGPGDQSEARQYVTGEVVHIHHRPWPLNSGVTLPNNYCHLSLHGSGHQGGFHFFTIVRRWRFLYRFLLFGQQWNKWFCLLLVNGSFIKIALASSSSICHTHTKLHFFFIVGQFHTLLDSLFL